MPYCPKCGRQVGENDLFCSNCGAPLKQQQTAQSSTAPSGQRGMFRQHGGYRERLREIFDRFRQKGATSPEKAMTAEELGLPPEFKEVMKRRLGRTGILVEVNGKYYLDEKRLEETREEMAGRRGIRR